MSEPFLAEVRLMGAAFHKVQPSSRPGVLPSIIGRSALGVQGFEAGASVDVVAELPAGVGVPWEVVLRLSDAETMRSWLELGREVNEWCAAHGVGDVAWGLDDEGLPIIPDEVAELDVPESVHTWTVGARDAVAAMQRLFPADD